MLVATVARVVDRQKVAQLLGHWAKAAQDGIGVRVR
jgi:hypothetical protein